MRKIADDNLFCGLRVKYMLGSQLVPTYLTSFHHTLEFLVEEFGLMFLSHHVPVKSSLVFLYLVQVTYQ